MRPTDEFEEYMNGDPHVVNTQLKDETLKAYQFLSDESEEND